MGRLKMIPQILEQIRLQFPDKLFKNPAKLTPLNSPAPLFNKDTAILANNSNNRALTSLSLNIKDMKNEKLISPSKLLGPDNPQNLKANQDVNSSSKIKFSQVSLGDGLNMYIPQNPVKPDGKVDIIIQFRGVVPDRFSEGNVNAMVITAETSGLSGPMMQKFGYKNFVPDIINKAMSIVKNKYGASVTQGRLAMGSFSAGYAPLAVALSNPEIRAKTDAVIVIDGIHYGKAGSPNPGGHQPFVDFAKEAAVGNKLMVITHSSIKPTYSSSTDAANYIINQVGAKRVPANDISNGYKNRYGEIISPASRADLNGFHVQGYNGDKAKSHIEQIDNLGNIWTRYLAPRWD